MISTEPPLVRECSATVSRIPQWLYLVRTCSGRAHDAAVAISDQVVVSGTSFIASLIIARACTKEEFGVYSLGLTLITILLGVQQALISSPYTMLRSRHTAGDERSYTGSTLVHYGMLDVAAVLVIASGTILWRPH